jgi:hypothetical protein
VDESSTGLTRNVGFDPFRLVKVTPSGQRHGTSNRRMGCASNNGGIPLERGSALHDPGPGLHLRKQSVRAWRSQAGFLPRGLIPSVDGRPSVSRRWATEAFPKSGRLSNASSDVSRTSPTVFRPAANSAFFIRVGIELHGLVSYPEALALAQARSFLRLHPSFDPVLIMNLEQTRIRVDVLCPQLLHHRPLVGPIVLPIREYVSKLAWIHASWRSSGNY